MLGVPAAIRDEMIAHAVEGYPYEVCGLLGGRGDQVARLYRARNKERSPVRYAIDDRDLLAALRDIDDADLDLVGIYHSHPYTLARPSATDIALATYPDARYVIISLVDVRPPAVREPGGVRAWRIQNGSVVEEPIRVL